MDAVKVLTWEDLTRREPRLKALLRDAQAVRDPGGPSFCANQVWYRPGGFKDRLIHLVGWDAVKSDPVLRTTKAYELATDEVYQALPDCRRCSCL